jgi:hypothetical protein
MGALALKARAMLSDGLASSSLVALLVTQDYRCVEGVVPQVSDHYPLHFSAEGLDGV